MLPSRQPTRKGSMRPSALSRFGSSLQKNQAREASPPAPSVNPAPTTTTTTTTTDLSSSPTSSVASLALEADAAGHHDASTNGRAATLPKRKLPKNESLRPSALKRFSTSTVSLIKGQNNDTGATPVPTGSPSSSILSLPLANGSEEGPMTEELRKKLEAAEDALAAESCKVAELRQQITELKASQAAIEQDNVAKQEKYSKQEEFLADTRTQLASALSEAARKEGELAAERREREKEAALQKEARMALEKQLEDVRAQLADTQRQLSIKDTKLETAWQQLSQATVSESGLQKNIEGLEAALKEAQDGAAKERESSYVEITKLKDELKRAQGGCLVQ